MRTARSLSLVVGKSFASTINLRKLCYECEIIKIVDLFEKVVPLAVHGAMMSFENRKVEMVNMEIGRLREATQLINSVKASLNLPAAIEDLSGMYLLPQTVPLTLGANKGNTC